MDTLSKWLFGTKTYRVLVLGEDGCGKTTFIDRLRFNHVSNYPKPTPGFYIGTLQYPVNTTWEFWELKTTEKHLPIVQSHLSPRILVLWLHDCESQETMPRLFPSLLADMVAAGCRYIWVGLNKQDLAGVSDERVQEIRRAYEEEFAKYDVQLSSGILRNKLCAKGREDTFEVMDEIYTAVMNVNLDPPRLTEGLNNSQQETGESPITEKLQSVVENEIGKDALDADGFWKLFLSGDLPAWRHYHYLKAAYIFVLDSSKNTFDMARDYKAHLHRFKESAPHFFRGNHLFKDTIDAQFSKIMTIFWILQIQYAIRAYRARSMMEDLPSRDEFHEILRHSPSLMDSLLWNRYYSYQPGFTANKHFWSAPDLRPLPIITHYRSDPAILPVGDKSQVRLIRYAFTVMRYVQQTGAPRSEIISQGVGTLQKTTMRLRTHDPLLAPYSETQTHFWIQIVDAALRALDDSGELGETNLTFEGFHERFNLKPTIWKQHYSATLWESVGARWKFISPDIAPLPTLIPVLSPTAISEKPDSSKISRGLPSIEELSFQVAMVVRDRTLKSEPLITSHAHLLSYLYTNLAGTRELSPLTLGQRARAVFAEISGPLGDGATHRNFWIQQVGVAVFHAEIEGISTFADFLTNSLHLVFEDLPTLYYSAGVWTSPAARDRVVTPDKRRLATIVELSETDGWVDVDEQIAR